LVGNSDPIDNTTYQINDYTSEGWRCVYNGSENSAIIDGLVPNTNYLIHICEYNGNESNELYLTSTTTSNPLQINTIFSEQKEIILDGVSEGSVAWGDYNKDSYLDFVLTGLHENEPIAKIYWNNGNNSFTEQVSSTLIGVYKSSVVLGDYNNDGDLDILLAGATGTESSNLNPICKIYKNNGDNSFSEQSNILLNGIYSGSVDWGDYDNDGDLDIVLTGKNNLNNPITKVHRNNGNGSFTEQTSIILQGVFNSSIAFNDLNNDGYLDIFMMGKNIENEIIAYIYFNTGNSSFIEQPTNAFIGLVEGSVSFGDYDNDGYLDILITGINSSNLPTTKLYRNNQDNSFIEQSDIFLTGVSSGSGIFGDYDNDGDLDILLSGNTNSEFISNIYRNNGDNTF